MIRPISKDASHEGTPVSRRRDGQRCVDQAGANRYAHPEGRRGKENTLAAKTQLPPARRGPSGVARPVADILSELIYDTSVTSEGLRRETHTASCSER